ncbi:MAG: hypothetical protein RMM58_15125 [Chloroflexota bacterium]|nr:hypothetical protein [Dehalococcoidia bacterium]MDW8255203.1 hypothetical protein [Chloroflexota bacterium]
MLSGAGCTPAVRQPLATLQATAATLARDRANTMADHLDAAHRYANSVDNPDLRDAVNALAAAWQRPDTPGGVQVVIEPVRNTEVALNLNAPGRTVKLIPIVENGRVRYLLRVDTPRYHAELQGPGELALHLYAASLMRDWYEANRAKGLDGPALVDALIAEPDGLMAAYYPAWETVIDKGYRPLRAAARLPAIPRLDTLAEARAACARAADRAACWQAAVRGYLGIIVRQ